MNLPKLHDKVVIRERPGIFFVVGVDEERGTVDVISASGTGRVEADISLAATRLLSDLDSNFPIDDWAGSRTVK